MGMNISAAEANRSFSSLLRGAREGRSYVITSHGKAVAKFVPADSEDKVRTAARKTLFERLRTQSVRAAARRWNRDDLYDDER